ncbi:MAG: acetylesterase [Chloroflexi bacterium]|nr:acetylesterase [Chloroflexota bacterium]
MSRHYQHLGVFSDWVDAAREQQPLFPVAPPGAETQHRVREVLGFCNRPETPRDVQIEQCWERDGLIGEEVSWSAGFGPRTHAYVLKPAHAQQPLPGVVALHCHGGFKFYGKERIADGATDPLPVIVEYRKKYYAGRAYANALAHAGFVVLVPDTFLWGSRKFPLDVMPAPVRDLTATILQAAPPDASTPFEIAQYNAAANQHEHWVAKYCNVLGTSLAGVVSYEDRVATNYLLSRADVTPDRIGCIGLSGGGNRAAMLNATHERIAATAIVGLMSTYEGLLDHNMSHTWMLFPFGWARYGDWSDLAACRAPSPLLVQYDLDDELFTEQGMRDADARLQQHYASVGTPAAYVGQFYPGPHKFDLEMQTAAFAWLKQSLT